MGQFDISRKLAILVNITVRSEGTASKHYENSKLDKNCLKESVHYKETTKLNISNFCFREPIVMTGVSSWLLITPGN